MGQAQLTVGIDVSAIPARPAGAGRYVVELVRALSERDDVRLVVLSRRGDVARWRVASAPTVLGIAPSSMMGRLFYGEVLLGGALRRRASLDVLHGPHYTLPVGRGTPAVVTVHDLTLIEHPEWHQRSKALFFQRALRLATRRADVVVVPSEFVARAFRRHFGEKVPIRAIPHGVDHERFVPEEPFAGADEGVLARHGLHGPYIFSIATTEPRKNLPRLVGAFASISARRPDLRLVLAGGSGWKNEALEDAIVRSGVESRIERLGYVPDDEVPALLRSAAVVAYPSIEEGFGLPALEALACGAPLVTTAGSAMAEVTGDAALLVDASSEREIALALEAAIDDSEETRRRRATGIERAKGFTWAASAASHLDAYGLAVASHVTRRPHRSA